MLVFTNFEDIFSMERLSPTNTSAQKVVLLGDSRVGKTSIIARQLQGFQSPTVNPTIGCHCSEIAVGPDDSKIVLQVWDTAGQEMYRALVPVYLRNARAALLVYDVTDRESFV
jgi:Ras-related protein Rab-21